MIAAGAVTGCFIGPWIGGRMARRTAYFILCLSSLAACNYMFRFVDTYGGEFLLSSYLAGLTTASFFGWLPLYLPELFPTRVRATGQGLCYNTGRIFAAVGAIQIGLLIDLLVGFGEKRGVQPGRWHGELLHRDAEFHFAPARASSP